MPSNVQQPVKSKRQKPNNMVMILILIHMIYHPSIASMESSPCNRSKANCSLCRGNNCNDPHCGQSNSPTPIANINKINKNQRFKSKKINTIATAQPSNANNNNTTTQSSNVKKNATNE